MSDKTVPVRYMGKKDSETDHLYGSGLTWIKGVADVQNVPIKFVPFLLAHADVWVDARKENQQAKNPIPAIVRPSLQTHDPAPQAVLLPEINLVTASKEDLVSYAAKNFNVEFQSDLPLQELRADVERLMKIHPYTPLAMTTTDTGVLGSDDDSSID